MKKLIIIALAAFALSSCTITSNNCMGNEWSYPLSKQYSCR